VRDNQYSVFDIQRFCIHDGPGIRTTVFLKGCPLSCMWCQNPEGLDSKREIVYDENKCVGCFECIRICPQGVFSIKSRRLEMDRDKCIQCGECTKTCYSGALHFSSDYMTKEEIIGQILLDKEFYTATGGGATFSGGEPLLDPASLHELLLECKARDINTAVETSLYIDFEKLKPLIESVDHFMVDLKIFDDTLHKKYTGVSNQIILSNLKKLISVHNNVVLRTPVIPGVNDNEQELSKIQTFIESLDNILYWELLPYHRLGENKYASLGREPKIFGKGFDKEGIRRLIKERTVPIKC